jgi:hypothetical protein
MFYWIEVELSSMDHIGSDDAYIDQANSGSSTLSVHRICNYRLGYMVEKVVHIWPSFQLIIFIFMALNQFIMKIHFIINLMYLFDIININIYYF